ncbi:GNAT family N-acetyltransferase [Bacillus toyonensis]|uniref:GNAT family N-acetyltransferase n=1 Tax=Bacillus toyonensis TaxID=155322 RepID=UPI000BFB1FCE|nr:GNAT family N-acetyltransferase [Bacillus toyonensis]PHG12220.1 GNAT family N-acetyltransferase [Bacillus toyonensis]
MNIILKRANEKDALDIFTMQITSFYPLLEKYQDYETSPANEPIQRTMTRIKYPNGGFYKIIVDGQFVGAICIYHKEKTNQFWISPMFIHPEFQGDGIAQKVLLLIEEMFPEAMSWELATILEEERNCFLYEKIGYKRTEVIKKLNDKATLIYYKKER